MDNQDVDPGSVRGKDGKYQEWGSEEKKVLAHRHLAFIV